MNRFRFGIVFAIFVSLAGAIEAADEPQPQAFTSVAVLHDDNALAGAHDVELQGNFAYVPGKGGSLAIIDIADPRKPRISSDVSSRLSTTTAHGFARARRCIGRSRPCASRLRVDSETRTGWT